MLIGVRHRFVFVANTKAASTSIEKALTPHAEINRVGHGNRKHAPWRLALREYDFLFGQPAHRPETYFKFGIVREPLDWVRSWYNYRLGNPRVDAPIAADMGFADWWREGSVRAYRPQHKFFRAAAGEPPLDLLLPLGDLAEGAPLIFRRIGVAVVALPQVNRSPGGLRADQIPAGLAAEILDHYRLDAELHAHWLTHWRTVLAAGPAPQLSAART